MSASDALAVLEVRVHLRLYIPDSYVFVTADVPDRLIKPVEDCTDLPADWRDNLAWSQTLGTKFIGQSWSLALSVPSRIVPAARNILLNPGHEEFSQVVAHPPKKFEWDERLWERATP